MRDGFKLRQRVGPPADAYIEARGSTAVAAGAENQPAEQQPRGGQSQIEPPALPARFPKRTSDKRAIVKQDHQRGRDHHFLGRHAQKAASHRSHRPEDGPALVRAANKTIQRQQIEQSHQRLGPLDDVSHGLGLQWMHGPEHGDRQSERQRRSAKPLAQGRPQQGLPHNPEQSQSREDMNRQVQRMVASHIGSAQGVVDGQREIEQGPAADRHAPLRR